MYLIISEKQYGLVQKVLTAKANDSTTNDLAQAELN